MMKEAEDLASETPWTYATILQFLVPIGFKPSSVVPALSILDVYVGSNYDSIFLSLSYFF